MAEKEPKNKNEAEIDAQKTLEEIAKIWKETINHFGKDFPFDKDLPFKIIDKGKEFKGIIEVEKKDGWERT